MLKIKFYGGDAMARIGYIRVSTKEQNIERQLAALHDTEKLFIDKVSGKTANRPQLTELLDFIREGDVVVITELDRLGRDNQDLTKIMNLIQDKNATLEVLSLPSTAGIQDDNLRRLITNLMLEIYKYQAESERQRIRERQSQGIAIAKKKGRYGGRKPMFDENDKRLLHAFELHKSGLSDKEIEEVTGINRETFRRYRHKYRLSRTEVKDKK